MPIGDVGPELTMALGAVLVLLVAVFTPRRHHGLCAWLALVTLAVAAAWTVSLATGTKARLSFAGTWALDGVTAWASHAILATTAIVIVLSPRWFRTDRRHGELYAILLLSALGAMLVAGAADLLELMVGMLLASVTGYTLASFHRASRMSAEAGAKLYFLGALANPLLFLGITFLYGVAGTTNYEGLTAAVDADGAALAVGAALVVVGLSFEIGAFPMHSWVPDVAEGSPAPAAAFLTVAPKIAALVALARFLSLLPDTLWRPALAVVAALTMSIGNLAALWQDDVRRLLGWSAVSQAGYGLMAVVALGRSPLALTALLLFIAAYASANLAAFAVVITLRGRTELPSYRGLAKSRPWLAVALTLALLSLTGIPPLVGFTAKLTLFSAAIAAGYAWLAALAVVNTVVSLFYYLRVIAPMFFAKPRAPAAVLSWQAACAAVVVAALTVAGGLAAQPLIDTGANATLLPVAPR